jgi:hypothetical protein
VQRSGSIFPRKLRPETFLPLWAPSEPQVGPRSILLGSQTLLLGSQPYLLGSQTAPVGEPKRTVWVLKSNVWEPKATIWDRSSVGLGPHLGPWDHILAHGAGLGPHVGPRTQVRVPRTALGSVPHRAWTRMCSHRPKCVSHGPKCGPKPTELRSQTLQKHSKCENLGLGWTLLGRKTNLCSYLGCFRYTHGADERGRYLPRDGPRAGPPGPRVDPGRGPRVTKISGIGPCFGSFLLRTNFCTVPFIFPL